MQLAAGTRVGRYVLEEALGRGGFGEVWRALDGSISRRVALKFLRLGDERDVARFGREARTAAGLEHPGIVPVFEIGEFEGRHFIAMEFVEGRTLDRLGLDPRKAAAAIREAALALQAAHERGVIHRDLKPQNLMMDKAGRVRVMDFGLARQVEGGATVTGSGMMVGTPSYMSPEQARGERVDARSDVYGLGATLYALLAGRAPFEGGDVLSIAMRVIEEEPVSPRRARPEVEAALEAVVLKALEKRPERRYGSMAEFAADLGRFLAGEPVMAARSSGVARWLRRRRLAAAGLAAVVVAGAIWAAISWRTRTTAAAAVDAKRSAMERLRQTSATCLQGALDMRRAGKPDAMESWAQRVEEACRGAMEGQPELAEPHYLLGRMRRAQMRDAEALALQSEALKRDPSFAPALYERIVLRGREYRTVLETLRQNESRARAGGGRVTRAPAAVTTAALKAMPEARARQEAIRADLAALRARPGDLGPAPLLVMSGIEAWMRGDNAEAEKSFHHAHDRDARLEEAIEWASECYQEDGIYSQAVKTLAKGIENDLGYVPFRELRALAGVRFAQHEASTGPERDAALREALADADEAVRMAPARAQSRFVRAMTRAGRGLCAGDGGGAEHREAIEEYTAALDLGADRHESLVERGAARVNLAHAEVEAGRDGQALYDAAISDFDLAIRERAEGYRAWTFRGNAHVGLARMEIRGGGDGSRNLKAALADFDEALKREPRAWETWLARAGAASSLGYVERDPAARCREAIRDSSEAIKLAPHESAAWHRRGLSRLNLVRPDGPDPAEDVHEALHDFDQAIRLDERYAEAYQDRGGVRVNYGLWLSSNRSNPSEWFRAGCADFDRALQLNPRLVEARSWRFNARRFLAVETEAAGEESVPWLEGVLEDGAHVLTWRNDAETNYHVGWAASVLASKRMTQNQESAGLFAKAVRHLAESARREPRNPETWLILGASRVNLALSAADREQQEALYAEAAEDLEKAMRLEPDEPLPVLYRGNARMNLALTRKQSGKPFETAAREALADYEAVIRMEPRWKSNVEPNLRVVKELLGK
jgi:serine/threonine-protein kinase